MQNAVRTFPVQFVTRRSRYTIQPDQAKVQTMNANPDIRWKQRFQNFDRAFVLLRGELEKGPEVLNQLEKEGVIQRFEYCFELQQEKMK